MAFIAGAIIIGAAATLGSAAISSSAASSAADAQSAAAANATAAQLQMFNTSVGLSAPTRNLGYGADTKLAALFGIDPGTLTNSSYGPTPNNVQSNATGWSGGVPSTTETSVGGGTSPGARTGMTVDANGKPVASPTGAPTTPTGSPDYSGFYNSPGFQFALGLGNQQVGRAQTAGGNLYSANTQTLESQYTTGFASQHYNDYVNQLLQMAGLGATSTTAAGNQAVATGQGISNNIIGGGNAQAAGAIGQAGAWTGAIGQIANNYNKYASAAPPPWQGTPADIQNAAYNQPVPQLIQQ